MTDGARSSSSAEVVEADWTWIGSEFEPGVRIEIDRAGVIRSIATADDSQTPETPQTTHRLAGHALLPGFVNAHSHAFQRGLRGQGETFPAGAGSFWSWREAMYGLVQRLDFDGAYDLSLQAFREMRSAGMTTVGEFHYLHHSGGASGDEADWAFDRAVLNAARDSGIRLVLLQTYYATGGIGQPLGAAQRRFRSDSVDRFKTQLDHLADRIDSSPRLSLGVVAHSVRAAEVDNIVALYKHARSLGLPFHMHVEEQPREIEDSIDAFGVPPMRLLTDRLPSCEGFTAVHCTHTAADDMERFAQAGGIVCLCPLTEANLGDGIADLTTMLEAEAPICLGSDSNARISMLEEARWMEYGQRLALGKRGVVRDDHGRIALRLLESTTVHGARALGVDVGTLAVGAPADLVAIDLHHDDLSGWQAETLLESLFFGAGNGAVAATAVDGNWQASSPRQ